MPRRGGSGAPPAWRGARPSSAGRRYAGGLGAARQHCQIRLDRPAVLSGSPRVVARHRERRAVPRAERHVLGVDVHRVPVALHGRRPVRPAHHGERVPHADARRHMVGVGGGGPLVPPDGLFGAALLHEQVSHSQEGKGVAGARLRRLPVGSLRLGGPAEARKRVAPAHQGPRVLAPASRPVHVRVVHGELQFGGFLLCILQRRSGLRN